MGGGSIRRHPRTSDKDKASKPGKSENKYPNATRKEPKLDMSAGDQKDLNKAADLVNDSKNDEAEPLVQKVIANEKASKYAQAFAHQLQAQIYWEKDKSAEAIAEYQQGDRARCAAERRALPGALPDRAAAGAGREIRRRAGDARSVGKADRRDNRRRARAEGERVLPHGQVPGCGRHDEESDRDVGQAERQLDADPDGELFRAQSVRSGGRRSCSSRCRRIRATRSF